LKPADLMLRLDPAFAVHCATWRSPFRPKTQATFADAHGDPARRSANRSISRTREKSGDVTPRMPPASRHGRVSADHSSSWRARSCRPCPACRRDPEGSSPRRGYGRSAKRSRMLRLAGANFATGVA
jgi:hypothetical protein